MRQHQSKVSSKEREAILSKMKEMIQNGVIQPSTSPWTSTNVLVAKKDGFTVFPWIIKNNKIRKKDVYNLFRMAHSLDRLRHYKYFSSIDLRSGYWKIRRDKQDREESVFTTPDVLCEFKLLPLSLRLATATFQRMMDSIASHLKWHSSLVYFDDVGSFSRTFYEHLKRLRAVFEAVRSAGLSLKAEKCHFALEELRFLGHLLSAEGVSPDPEKRGAIGASPAPTNERAVRRFLGLCAYYRYIT